MALRNRKYFEGNAYFITTSINKFVKIFRQRKYIDIILKNINFYRRKYDFKLIGYVIMPDHIHLLIYPDQNRIKEFSNILEDFKKFTSRKLRTEMEKDKKTAWLRFFRLDETKRRNWKYHIWQQGYDDLGVYNPKVVRTKLNYIHNNPVRKGLVEKPEDYLYSSARNYILDDQSIIRVNTELLNF
jgi:REP element-mobilizing transposase RayT